jgi:hypothetical protein
MAIAQVLAVGVTAADSADVVVAANTTLSVALKNTSGAAPGVDARILVKRKDDAGAYNVVDELHANRRQASFGEGTYRFSRLAAANGSCGLISG